MLANNAAGTLESQRFGKTKFLAFYQPYQVPKEFISAHNEIKNRISTIKYAVDVSSVYDVYGKEVWTDTVHVNQRANELMGTKIALIIAKELQVGKATIEK